MRRPLRDPELERMWQVARDLGARMGLAGGGGGGSGSGLPAGGAVGQAVINTGPGAGSWQDILAELVAGSSHITLAASGHQAAIDLSAADKGLLAGLANHYAEYTFSFSVPNTGNNVITSGWTNVHDTDNYGSTINTNGQLTVPAGLAGLYVVTNVGLFPSIANAAGVLLQKNGATVSGFLAPQSTTFNDIFCGSYVGLCAVGDNFTTLLDQASGAAQTCTGRMSLALIAPSTASAGVSGLVDIAKTTAYTANPSDWVYADTTGGTFAVTMPAAPAAGTIVAVTWKAGGVAPTLAGNGNTILGSPTFGAIGNTIWLKFSTVANAWVVV